MPNSSPFRVLVIGAGSIGERHIHAFRRMDGVSVSFVETQEARARQISERYECADWFNDLHAVPFHQFDAAVIATSADSHIPLSVLCAEAGLHLLVEKPLSASLDGVDRLISLCDEKQLTAAVGYTLRFHPTVAKLRELVRSSAIGKPISVQAACTHYLPDSRPDYRRAYYGTRNAAAGVILDLSHELNYIEWIFGALQLEASRRAGVEKLGIADEGIADLWLSSPSGLLGEIHLHAADRCVRRECHIAGSDGTLTTDLLSGQILLMRADGSTCHYEAISERDEWHLDQARDFLEAIQQSRPPRCTLKEALGTLSVCLEAMKSPLQVAGVTNDAAGA